MPVKHARISKPGAPAVGLSVGERESKGIVILDLNGRVVPGETDLQARIRRLIHDGKTHLVLNLQNLQPLVPGALCTLLVCLAKARQASGDLRLVNVTPANLRLLQHTKTAAAFQIFGDERLAIDSFLPAPSAWAGKWLSMKSA